MPPNRSRCIERVVLTARLLDELAGEVVFAGGAAAGLLMTDPAAPDVRTTLDVDVVVEVASTVEYYRLTERLRAKGFHEEVGGTVICRFVHHDPELILDVMPTAKAALGFYNQWYADAARFPLRMDVDDVALRVIAPAYFLGTKFVAFHGRGGGDFQLSKDMEDLIAVVDGRPQIVGDVAGSDVGIRRYLAREFGDLLRDRDFLEALPGFLPGDAASQRRVPILRDRMEAMAGGAG